MTGRVERLLRAGVPPQRILAVTFTRLAANDLHRDLADVDDPGSTQLQARTLHSLALGMLGRKDLLAHFERNPRILYEFERAPLIADLQLLKYSKSTVDMGIKAYEAAWARLQHDDPGYSQSPNERTFEEDLVAWLKFHEVMLIGETVPMLLRHLERHSELSDKSPYRHVLVDEYQDLNRAEQRLVEAVAPSAHFFVVGDEDQSIYQFKHAHPEGIREWPEQGGAKEFELALCRRCPSQVVEMANSLIAHNDRPERIALKPDPDNGDGHVEIWQLGSVGKEADFVATRIARESANGEAIEDTIVLVPDKRIGEAVVKSLAKQGVAVRSLFQEAAVDQIDVQGRLQLAVLWAIAMIALHCDGCSALATRNGTPRCIRCFAIVARIPIVPRGKRSRPLQTLCSTLAYRPRWLTGSVVFEPSSKSSMSR